MSDLNNPDQPYGQVPPPPPPPQPGYPYGGHPAPPPPGAIPANPYAHWGLRLGATLLDGLLLMPFYVVAFAALAAGSDADGNLSGTAVALVIAGYAAGVGFAIWNQIIRQGRTGQSLGKQWVDIRLIKEENGQPLGGWLTFGRSLLHILDQLPCYLGYFWPLWDAKRQTFADKIVKSVVIRA